MKCPICGSNLKNKAAVLIHIDTDHRDEIPEGWSAQHYYYSLTHGGNDTGKCDICKRTVEFDEAAGKPPKLCGRPECKSAWSKRSRERAKAKAGDDPDGYESNRQRNALDGREMAGRYAWSDGTEKGYMGKMELKILRALDHIAELSSHGVFSPCPFDVYYNDEDGKRRLYIPDIYLIDFNLIIEVKEDRKNNPNTHPKIMKVDREREKLKDKRIKEMDDFHYYKYMGDNEELLDVLTQIRLKNSGNSRKDKDKHIYILNESTTVQDERLEEELYVGLIHPPGMNHITNDIIFSYTSTFSTLYYFDLEDEEVKTSSITNARFKNMGITVSRYVGNNPGVPTNFLREITEYGIDDKESIQDQYAFFGKILNLVEPRTVSDTVIRPNEFKQGNFAIIASHEDTDAVAKGFERMMESVEYMGSLLEAVRCGETELKEIDGEELLRMKSIGMNIPTGARCFIDKDTNEIIIAKGEQAVAIGDLDSVSLKQIDILSNK